MTQSGHNGPLTTALGNFRLISVEQRLPVQRQMKLQKMLRPSSNLMTPNV
jgi:hypothetical protein